MQAFLRDYSENSFRPLRPSLAIPPPGPSATEGPSRKRDRMTGGSGVGWLCGEGMAWPYGLEWQRFTGRRGFPEHPRFH